MFKVVTVFAIISFQSIVAGDPKLVVGDPMHGGPNTCHIEVFTNIAEKYYKVTPIAEAKKFNEAKFLKIACTERLIDALVSYAMVQIQKDNEQQTKNKEKMREDSHKGAMLSIDHISTENPTVWHRQGMQPAFNDTNVLNYLSYLSPGAIQSLEVAVKKAGTGESITEPVWNKNDGQIFDYLEKEGIWQKAYARAAQLSHYVDQKLPDVPTYSNSLKTPDVIAQEIVQAWLNEVKDPDWDRETAIKMQPQYPKNIENAHGTPLPIHNGKLIFGHNKTRFDAQDKLYWKIYNSKEVSELKITFEEIKGKPTVVYPWWAKWPVCIGYAIARFFEWSDTVPQLKLSRQKRDKAMATSVRNWDTIKKLLPQNLIDLLDNSTNKRVRLAASDFYIALDNFNETKKRYCFCGTKELCKRCDDLNIWRQQAYDNSKPSDGQFLGSDSLPSCFTDCMIDIVIKKKIINQFNTWGFTDQKLKNEYSVLNEAAKEIVDNVSPGEKKLIESFVLKTKTS